MKKDKSMAEHDLTAYITSEFANTTATELRRTNRMIQEGIGIHYEATYIQIVLQEMKAERCMVGNQRGWLFLRENYPVKTEPVLTLEEVTNQLRLANERIAPLEQKLAKTEAMMQETLKERDQARTMAAEMQSLALNAGGRINHLQNTNAQLISAAADSALAHRLDAQAFAEATRPRNMSAVNTKAKA